MKKSNLYLILGSLFFAGLLTYVTYQDLNGMGDYVFIYPFNLADGSLIAYRTFQIIIMTSIVIANTVWLLPKVLTKHGFTGYALVLLIFLFGVFLLEQAYIGVLKNIYDLPNAIEKLYGTVYSELPVKREIDIDYFWTYALPLILSFSIKYLQDYQIAQKERNRNLELISQKWRTELDFLKSQVNPHFLFNTLNIIYATANRNKDEETAKAIAKLSNLIRFMVYDARKGKVPLQHELDYIQDYVDLQQDRFQEGEVIVSFHVSGDAQKTKISPLLLVPFVENAFKHGIKVNDTSLLSIGLNVMDEKVVFKVQNPIRNAKGEDRVYSGIGIDNVKKRLHLEYPDKHELIISTQDEIYKVELTLEI